MLTICLHYLFLKCIALLCRLYAEIFHRKDLHHDRTLRIASRDQGRDILVHVYELSPDPEPSPKPILINLSGSGWVTHDHGTDDEFCHYIRDNTGWTVLDVKYRIAPEHPYPAAMQDVDDVIQYVDAQRELYKEHHIAISGFGAGANIALSTAMHSRMILRLYSCYLRGGTNPQDPRVSPARNITPALFPNLGIIITAERDTLANEGMEMARILGDLPRRTIDHCRVTNCGHAWDKSWWGGRSES
ncbi:Alpha/Beta hydrolase protein [Aspergillus ambiguus]|uniref:alpha/beta hydrolase n=1 Tax=Aspergillus ambiguus TaxID=176160 RepID=UPI003CCDE840